MGIIYPGLFGRARLLGRADYDAILVPENAVNTDQDKKFLYVVDEENKVHRRYVTIGTLLDNGFIVISDGIESGDRIVVNGIQRIRMAAQVITPNETELVWKEIDTIVRSENTTSDQHTEQQ